MKSLSLVVLGTIVCLLTACDQKSPVPAIPKKKTTFQKIVFTEPKYGSTITLISETECEIKARGDIRLAEYTRQENKLRVVERAFGAASVHYFDILPDGVRESDSGEMYLLPEPLNKLHEQERIAQEAEAARQRAEQMEQERQRQIEIENARELRKRLIENRDAIIHDVSVFLSKGSVFNATYFFNPLHHKDPNLPFQITITGDLTFKNFGYEEIGTSVGSEYRRDSNDPLDQVFGIPAHFKWLGETDTISPSSWGGKIREYDGMFIGAIKIQNKSGMNPVWRVTMKFCIIDPSWPGMWVSREDGSTWNGIQFEGNSRQSIKLLKP